MTNSPSHVSSTPTFPPELGRRYPVVVRGEGVWLKDSAGNRYLDAMSGGSMAATLGHGRRDIIAAARRQADRVTYVHNERLTNPAQESLATELIGVAPPGFTRAKFVTGGSEANETAIRLARAYHVERGESQRWQIVSPAQAYHGPTFETLALTGRPGLQDPLGPYLTNHLHIPPSTWRFDPSGEAALEALDGALAEAGPENVAAFFCEPISAAALPAYTPPERFWRGLAERREQHGFLICFDEVVTGMGRTGTWFAYQQLPIQPDIVTAGKGLGAGYAPLAAVLCGEHVYEAIAAGSRSFEHGHTWDDAPLPCAVGLAVMDVLIERGLIERVHTRGPSLRDELEAALADLKIVREVRGRGFLLGVEFVDPRDGASILPDELHLDELIDDIAFEHGLLVTSTHPNRDGYASDQTLLAPAFVSSDGELAAMIERLARTLAVVEQRVTEALS